MRYVKVIQLPMSEEIVNCQISTTNIYCLESCSQKKRDCLYSWEIEYLCYF